MDRRLSVLGLLYRKAIPATHRGVVQTLFQPERALIVVRDRPELGRQVLIFLSRSRQCLLHSFPKAGQHRIVKIRPAEIEAMLAEWFPVNEGTTNDAVLMSEAQMMELVSSPPEGIPSELSNVDSAIAQRLMTSLRTRAWSGSFLLLEVRGGKAADAESWTAWSNGELTWVGDLYHPSGIMRLTCGGDWFTGLCRQIVRRLGQFERIVRAYALSSEELAYALVLLNRRDLAGRWMAPASTQETEERLQKAAQILQARGLSGISPRGFPLLAGDLEQALAPMLLPTRIGRIRTFSGRGRAEGILYILKNRSFCAHFPKGKQHVIESGNIEQLPAYLMSLFRGFGEKEVSSTKAIPISMQALIECLDQKDRTTMEANLRKAGLTKSIAANLAGDILQHEYRASLNGIRPMNRNTPRQEEASAPTLLLLKSPQRDWLFFFPDMKTDTVGKAIQADRKRLLQQLGAITDLPSQ
ncbi:MAG: hypothetical protein ACOYZ8_06800 [Chloroflexota bacterium]